MPCLVTFGFLLYAACKRFGDIDSGLVCDAEKYPKDNGISHHHAGTAGGL